MSISCCMVVVVVVVVVVVCLFWGTIMRPYCNCMGYGLLYGGCFAVAVASVVVVVVVVWL